MPPPQRAPVGAHPDPTPKRLVTAAPASQLHSHGFWCTKKEQGQQKLTDLPAFAHFGKLEPPEVLQAFAVWCACHGRPFAITDDSKLHGLLDEVVRRHRPSASAMSAAVRDLADFCQEEVLGMIERAVGGIYLALDAWTSPNGVEVLGVLAFFKTKVGKGELKHDVVPVSFQPLVDRHSGAYLAEVVRDICEVYDIQEKVLGIASDNASNTGKMMEELEDYGIGPDKWVHILNLLVSTLFAYFDNTGKAKPSDPKEPSHEEEPSYQERQLALESPFDGESDNEDGEDLRAHEMNEEELEGVYADVQGRSDQAPRPDQEIDEEEVDRFEPRRESSTDRYTRSSTRFTIMKAQRLAERFRYNSACRKALVSLSTAAVPPPPCPHSIYPAVKTRWNSRTRQFRQIVNHRAQIDKIQSDPKFKFKKEN
ncbi:hypothetical protein JCM1840_006821 [Sporobolomyces johnsonii]